MYIYLNLYFFQSLVICFEGPLTPGTFVFSAGTQASSSSIRVGSRARGGLSNGSGVTWNNSFRTEIELQLSEASTSSEQTIGTGRMLLLAAIPSRAVTLLLVAFIFPESARLGLVENLPATSDPPRSSLTLFGRGRVKGDLLGSMGSSGSSNTGILSHPVVVADTARLFLEAPPSDNDDASLLGPAIVDASSVVSIAADGTLEQAAVLDDDSELVVLDMASSESLAFRLERMAVSLAFLFTTGRSRLSSSPIGDRGREGKGAKPIAANSIALCGRGRDGGVRGPESGTFRSCDRQGKDIVELGLSFELSLADFGHLSPSDCSPFDKEVIKLASGFIISAADISKSASGCIVSDADVPSLVSACKLCKEDVPMLATGCSVFEADVSKMASDGSMALMASGSLFSLG